MARTVIDPGNIHTRRDQLALDPDDQYQRQRAARTVRRIALDDCDAADLLAMLGLDTELDSRKCPNGHPCDNNGECRVTGCPYAKATT